MAVFRTQKNRENPYVMLNKGMLNNRGLSWGAKGLLAYLLSLPDDWQIHDSELQTRSTNGKDSLKNLMLELINAGYVQREQGREDSGKFAQKVYLIYEAPINIAVNGFPVNGLTVDGESATNNNKREKVIREEEKRLVGQPDTPLLFNKPCRGKNPNVSEVSVADVVAYLNTKASTRYKATTAGTKKHILARVKEGHTLEEFKKVIDTKCGQWLGNAKMEAYLRPETLFGNKFESYLNEKPAIGITGKGASVESIDREKLKAIAMVNNEEDDEIF